MNTSQSITNDQHRATADEWACVKEYNSEISFSCLLELRDRIEALEATLHAHADASHVIDPEREKATRELAQSAGFAPRWSEFERCAAIIDSLNEAKPADSPPQPSHPEIPGGSLVERVEDAVYRKSATHSPIRVAITEVAAWLNTVQQFDAAALLRLEAEQ
jgi:hypothetical protein